jgi:hypothetical protein
MRFTTPLVALSLAGSGLASFDIFTNTKQYSLSSYSNSAAVFYPSHLTWNQQTDEPNPSSHLRLRSLLPCKKNGPLHSPPTTPKSQRHPNGPARGRSSTPTSSQARTCRPKLQPRISTPSTPLRRTGMLPSFPLRLIVNMALPSCPLLPAPTGCMRTSNRTNPSIGSSPCQPTQRSTSRASSPSRRRFTRVLLRR